MALVADFAVMTAVILTTFDLCRIASSELQTTFHFCSSSSIWCCHLHHNLHHFWLYSVESCFSHSFHQISSRCSAMCYLLRYFFGILRCTSDSDSILSDPCQDLNPGLSACNPVCCHSATHSHVSDHKNQTIFSYFLVIFMHILWCFSDIRSKIMR